MNAPKQLAHQLESFEDMRAFAHHWYPAARAVLMAWSRRHESAAVVGILDADGRELLATGERLVLLSALLSQPLSPAALSLVYPDVDYSSGQVLFMIEATRPIPELLAMRLIQDLTAGEPVTDDHLRLGIRLLAGQAGLPTASLRVRRHANGRNFGIVEFTSTRDGRGTAAPGNLAEQRLNEVWLAEALKLFADELGQRTDLWQVASKPDLILALG